MSSYRFLTAFPSWALFHWSASWKSPPVHICILYQINAVIGRSPWTKKCRERLRMEKGKIVLRRDLASNSNNYMVIRIKEFETRCLSWAGQLFIRNPTLTISTVWRIPLRYPSSCWWRRAYTAKNPVKQGSCLITNAIARAIAFGGIAISSRMTASRSLTSVFVTSSAKFVRTIPGEMTVTRSWSPASWRSPTNRLLNISSLQSVYNFFHMLSRPVTDYLLGVSLIIFFSSPQAVMRLRIPTIFEPISLSHGRCKVRSRRQLLRLLKRSYFVFFCHLIGFR